MSAEAGTTFLAAVQEALPGEMLGDIEIVDVGASDVNPAERPCYDALLEAGLGRLTGFEPNPDEFGKLPQTSLRRYLQIAVGDGTDQHLNITRFAGFTSTLEPNLPLAREIANFEPKMAVEATMAINTARMDDVADIDRMDFLKIDIQGGEQAAFEGARRLLTRCLCVHTETAFVPLYHDQPLFGDQHRTLTEAGLMFLGFHSVNRHPLKSRFRRLTAEASARDLGAWIDADAVFVRDVRTWDSLEDADLVRLFLILSVAYFAPSGALRLAQMLEKRRVARAGLLQAALEYFNAG